jgi:hypothetical protein
MEMGKAGLTPRGATKRYPELTQSEGTLANWRMQGRGPRFYRVGRKIVYKPEDIEAFLFQNPVHTIDSVRAGQ